MSDLIAELRARSLHADDALAARPVGLGDALRRAADEIARLRGVIAAAHEIVGMPRHWVGHIEPGTERLRPVDQTIRCRCATTFGTSTLIDADRIDDPLDGALDAWLAESLPWLKERHAAHVAAILEGRTS